MNATQVLVLVWAVSTLVFQSRVPIGPQPSVLAALLTTIGFFVTVALVVRGLDRPSPRLAHLTPDRRRLARQLWMLMGIFSAMERLPRLATGLASGAMPTEWSLLDRAFTTVGQVAMFAGMFVLMGGRRPAPPRSTTAPAGVDLRALSRLPAALGVVCLAGAVWCYARRGGEPEILGCLALVLLTAAALMRWPSRPPKWS